MAALRCVTDVASRFASKSFPRIKRAPILKAYLQRAPGARPHVPVNKDAPLSEFEQVAAHVPVFRVVPESLAA